MDDVPWLNEAELVIWKDYVASTMILNGALERQLQHDIGIPFTYYMVLVLLSEAPDRTQSMSVLARLNQSSPSRVSHAVARMEEQGWVTRQRDSVNARLVRATLTDAGDRLLQRAAPGHVRQARVSLFDRLTPEQIVQLGEIAQAIRGDLDMREGSSTQLASMDPGPGV